MYFARIPAVLVCILALQLLCASKPAQPDMERDDSGGQHNGHHSQVFTIEDLREKLQTAIAMKQFMAPVLYTTWATIKPTTEGNREIREMLLATETQETAHMASVANILNAVGGEPDLRCSTIMPNYPSHVPGGVLPGLRVPIKKMSLRLVKEKFMAFELPEFTIEPSPNSFGKRSPIKKEFVEVELSGATTIKKDHPSRSFDAKLTQCEDWMRKYCLAQQDSHLRQSRSYGKYQVVHHEKTVAEFFKHLICEMVMLECDALEKGSTIFTGNVSRQISGANNVTSITNIQEAVETIERFIIEGQGPDICKPTFKWSDGSTGLSRYYTLEAVYNQHDIAFYKDDSAPWVCNGEMFFFNGREIPFDSSEVWNMVPNPDMAMYSEGSIQWERAQDVNGNYTRLLDMLNTAFNGSPESFWDTIPQMFRFNRSLNALVQTPLAQNPNMMAGPTYDCVSLT